jgi:putative cell wall-binding protein
VFLLKKIILSIVVGVCLILNFHIVHAEGNYNVIRISGNDRYETSLNIANNFFNHDSKNVIIASGENFPDAITSGILSKKLGAPIFLVKKDQLPDRTFGNYIHDSQSEGNIYILGGTASVNNEYDKVPGYTKTIRLNGSDRFSTNSAIVNHVNVEKGAPVIIVNGFQFADALSVSSISAVKGYPIIMSSGDKLNDSAAQMLKNIEPSQVFIIGGQGSISNNVANDIKSTVKNLDDSKITRISGADRYETSLNVCKYFNLNGDTAIIASGEDFPDALSGTALAAKLNAPIILTNGNDISAQKRYLDTTSCKKIILIGGQSSVSADIESKLTGMSNTIVTFPDKNFEAVIRKKINKPSGDIYINDVRSIIELNANNNAISDLSGIEKLTNLKKLNLSYNIITNLEPLSGLTNLENLKLDHNIYLSNLSGIDKLTNLKDLNLDSDNATSLESLKSLANLESLELDFNKTINDITPIENLSKLTSLSLTNDDISNIGTLAKLNNLNELELDVNKITDISSLKNLKNLNYLGLSNNQITDISVLKGLTNVSKLYLNKNQIKDTSCLCQVLVGNFFFEIFPL